jgi:hypothetical protein
MSQHLSHGQLEKYISRNLSPDQLLEVDDHLAGCPECMQGMKAAQQISIDSLENVLMSAGVPDHLTYEQLSGYVDGSLTDADREIVDLHGDVCRQCSVEIENLKVLRSALAADREASATRKHTIPAKGFFTTWRFKFAMAAAVIAVVVMSWFGLRNTRRSDLPVVAAIEPSPMPEASSSGEQPAALSSPESETPRTIASINDGGRRIELDSSGTLTGLASTEFEQEYRLALTSRAIEIPADVARLKGPSGSLMGGGGDGVPFRIIGPVGRVIESAKPTLRWQPLAGAQKYKVGIFDENFNEVAASPELTSTSWTPAELARGRTYQWQVTAYRGQEEIASPSRPAPEAKFKVVDRSHYSDIEKARRSGSRLLLGVAYANAGLLDDAEREFESLLKSNPDSEVVKRHLAKVRAAK